MAPELILMISNVDSPGSRETLSQSRHHRLRRCEQSHNQETSCQTLCASSTALWLSVIMRGT